MMPKPVVVGTDGSGESLHAVEWAAAEAARRSAPLRIVSVMAVPVHATAGESPVTLEDLMDGIYQQLLQTTASRAAAVAPDLQVDTELRTGPPGQVLAEEAATASMLVVGAYGVGGYAQPGAGPETRFVTLRASCPIAVIRDPGAIEHGEIAVGVRTVDGAQAALRFAFEEAALREAHLAVVHAFDENTPWLGRLRESMASWQCQFPKVAVSYREINGHPGRILTAYSNFTDLVVVGRHNGSSHNLSHGSVMQALLNHAQAPVVIVPSD